MTAPSSSPDATRDALRRKEKLLVVGKSYCPFTQRAKKALADIGVKPACVDLDLMRDGDALQARAARLTRRILNASALRPAAGSDAAAHRIGQSSFSSISGIRTVPQVFVDGACVGGCDDTLAALRVGTMQQRLTACGLSVAGS